MTSPSNGTERGSSAAVELVVVHVKDAINPMLAGHGDATYQSPPQPRDAALNLVRLLLGRHDEAEAHESRWTCPIAGGRRTVRLEPAASGAIGAGDTQH
jgi:hypothetical protein